MPLINMESVVEWENYHSATITVKIGSGKIYQWMLNLRGDSEEK
jgi:hypothetical protein